MDDTQASLKASDAAAATRKRRSSILKNQRPPRTPFSEVEFNAATPTDTTKSRRVSFSRRTGVAEFITNEATTTWKIFYEEHNKSLESSGNDSVANAPRQTIEHIGKRIFDQQFEEVEAVDFEGTLHVNPLQEFQASFNNINLTQQLASLECMTNDLKFVAPQSKFEQSALTELSKPFGNDIHVPVLEDMTNPISMNFSAMQTLSSSCKCDDLDEIEKDLERSKTGSMSTGKDFSGLIEVGDLDMTHAVHNNESEMSITDTIKSPKVQDVSRSDLSVQKGKLPKLDDDWINDKENIAINPYVAPKESLNFAVNKASDEVLVFDGKKLTTQPIAIKIPEEDKENFRQTLLPNIPVIAPQRKTIILNVNDDLPNFVENNCSESNVKLLAGNHSKNSMIFNDINTSITTPIDNRIKIFQDTDIDNNMLPNTSSNVLDKHGNQNTIYNNEISNISFTQAIPSNILSPTKEANKQNEYNTLNKTRNNTIHYDGMTQDISMTQMIPNNIIQNEEKKLQIETEKRKTIIFDSDSCDISMTQALPTNIDLNEKENDYKSYSNNASTQDSKKSISTDKRNTIIFDNDACDISMTQALPTNININKEEIEKDFQADKKVLTKENFEERIATKKRETIIFDDNTCNISITQALPTNINTIKNESNKASIIENAKEITTKKRKTIIFDDNSCDVSMTQALPTNINVNKEVIEKDYQLYNKVATNENPEKRKTIIFDHDSCNISITQALPTNINVNKVENDYLTQLNATKEKRKTVIFDDESCDISMTQAIPVNIVLNANDNEQVSLNNIATSNQFSMNKDDLEKDMQCNIPHDISNKFLNSENSDFKVENVDDVDKVSKDVSKNEIIPIKDIEKRRTALFDSELCNVSTMQSVTPNIYLNNVEDKKLISSHAYRNNSPDKKENSIKNLIENSNQLIPNQVQISEPKREERKSIVYDNNIADISKTSIGPNTLLQDANQEDAEYLNASNPVKPGCNSIEMNRPGEINHDMNITTNIDHNNEERLQWAALEKMDVTVDNKHLTLTKPIRTNRIDIEKDLTSKFIDNSVEFKTNILLYQVDTGKPRKEININKNIHDYSVKNEVNKSMHTEMITTNSVCDKSAMKFSNDEDKNPKMSKSLKEETFSENKLQTENKNNKSKLKISILNELLDMSCESIEDISGMEQNNDINDQPLKNVSKMKDEIVETSILKEQISKCKESSLIIHSNSETVMNNTKKIFDDHPEITEKPKNIDSVSFLKSESNENNLVQKCKNEELDDQGRKSIHENMIDDELKDENTENKTELHKSATVVTDNFNYSKGCKSFRNADNTKDLLQMLSDFTDEGGDESATEEKTMEDLCQEKSAPPSEPENDMKDLCQEKSAPPSDSENDMECEYKNNIQEPKRLSFALRRQSIVISREDLLNNISMAKAVLQQSRFEVDESEIMDDTSESIDLQEPNLSHKSTRVSSEVVKTLQFEDESISDISIKTEIKMSPLKKTVLGETTYTSDSKAKVIPTYLKDASDNIKELMHDLVKPTSDIPFQNVPAKNNVPSICNTEVQANIMTSSQIDIDVDLQSNPEAVCSLNKNKSILTDVKPIDNILDIKKDQEISPTEETNVSTDISKPLSPQQTDRVVIFDHDNPLRNILLPTINYSDAHQYNRLLENETQNQEEKLQECIDGKIDQKRLNQSIQYHMELDQNTQSLDVKVELSQLRKSIQNDMHQQISIQKNMQSGDTACEKSSNTPSIASNISKALSIDKSVEGFTTDVKDTEVNTIIVMKENKELLQQSSCLTLVDGELTDSECKINTRQSSEESTKCDSPVRLIYKSENEFIEKDSDATSNEVLSDRDDIEAKARKRSYSPTNKDCALSNIDVTPKPINKMQKMSNSPLSKSINKSHRVEVQTNIDENHAKSQSNENYSLAHTEIVQHLEVQYNCNKSINKSIKISQTSSLDTEIVLTSTEDVKSENILSFSNVDDMQNPRVRVFQVLSSVASQISGVTEEKNLNKKIEIEYRPNIVDNINMLSFMGSPECVWECGGCDSWAFRLLCGRLRLRARFDRPHRDVREDTPLTDIDVEVVHPDDKDSLAALCVNLAAEAMRYERSRLSEPGAVRAGELATLLRRCVLLARLARRWARAMRDARARLAYDVTPDGLITLKVANIPLRCVWEVRMRVSLEVGDGVSGAFPRAGQLRAAPVLPPRAPPLDLRRLTTAPPPSDWGHAPRTLWKVFKYLKNRTRSEDLLGI